MSICSRLGAADVCNVQQRQKREKFGCCPGTPGRVLKDGRGIKANWEGGGIGFREFRKWNWRKAVREWER